MTPEFCAIINSVLISRLLFTFRDKPTARIQVILMSLLQIGSLLLLSARVWTLILAAALAALNALFFRLENKLKKINELRLISLFSYILLLSVFFAPWLDLRFSRSLSAAVQALGAYSSLFTIAFRVDWLQVNIIMMGLLLATNEANILIRFLFHAFNLTPKKPIETDSRIISRIDQREYNAGRIIGILERTFIYFFVLQSQFAAMGFILAAKSFTRFRELEKREFAEYVLIGTLLSALLAMLMAELVRYVLSSGRLINL